MKRELERLASTTVFLVGLVGFLVCAFLFLLAAWVLVAIALKLIF